MRELIIASIIEQQRNVLVRLETIDFMLHDHHLPVESYNALVSEQSALRLQLENMKAYT